MPTSTVCLIAKDEEKAILEWLAYQKLVGFDQIMVYDNDSSDRTREIVMRACYNDRSISYKLWPNQPGLRPQPTAYADGLTACTTDWIAFFDTDEFLLLDQHHSVDDYLNTFGSEVGGIIVNWFIFGSSGRIEPGEGLVIERFLSCAAPTHGKNLLCKSIVRPAGVAEMKVHTALLSEGLIYVDSEGNPIDIPFGSGKAPRINHKGARLNHYLLKSREEFLRKKLRGHASRSLEDASKHHIDEEFWVAHDLNDYKDQTILCHIENLRTEMARLAQ
jgi:hypothetical protein